jgi:hypothetical protein
MSNIAGKAYAMNLLTPIDGQLMTWANKLIFWAVGTRYFRDKLNGLLTLSMIHYARWAIVQPHEWPRLSETQPQERLRYSYMFFFSNFNGSWAQYIDSFSAAIPSGLNLLWWENVGWPESVPEQPFHRYVSHNQFYTNHYYSAYPMAASNDVKAAQRVKQRLNALIDATAGASPEAFVAQYHLALRDLQGDLGRMSPTPIVSLAHAATEERRRADERAPPSLWRGRPSELERVG